MGSVHLTLLSQQSLDNQLSASPSCQGVRPEGWGSAYLQSLSPELQRRRQH